jgi:hypothetical protein
MLNVLNDHVEPLVLLLGKVHATKSSSNKIIVRNALMSLEQEFHILIGQANSGIRNEGMTDMIIEL